MQKGGIPHFGKEGSFDRAHGHELVEWLGEIFGSICLLNYGLLGKWEMKNEMNLVIGLLGNSCLPAGREAYLEVGIWCLEFRVVYKTTISSTYFTQSNP
ncbi:MAG: hypothetical protein A2157_03050 [Deltaproteobacteria bacterium RBG_16_47_11]|nr:MAG: hypothetical protein A2157_03050 [Deltaproteobacteria bacterium RBG_16_47_11]